MTDLFTYLELSNTVAQLICVPIMIVAIQGLTAAIKEDDRFLIKNLKRNIILGTSVIVALNLLPTHDKMYKLKLSKLKNEAISSKNIDRLEKIVTKILAAGEQL